MPCPVLTWWRLRYAMPGTGIALWDVPYWLCETMSSTDPGNAGTRWRGWVGTDLGCGGTRWRG
eukprot:1466877-Rhodomonas_salina.4